MTKLQAEAVAGLILAGGQSRRMGGGHKSLLPLDGASLLERAVTRMRPQVASLALNVNQDMPRFQGFGLPLLPDLEPDFAGPLAGVEAGLTWAMELRRNGQALRYLALASCDAPFFPRDLVARLGAVLEQDETARIAMASSQGRRHPVFSLWSLDLLEPLQTALRAGTRKVEAFTEPQGVVALDWPLTQADGGPFDPFFNINRPEDLAEAERIAVSSDT